MLVFGKDQMKSNLHVSFIYMTLKLSRFDKNKNMIEQSNLNVDPEW